MIDPTSRPKSTDNRHLPVLQIVGVLIIVLSIAGLCLLGALPI